MGIQPGSQIRTVSLSRLSQKAFLTAKYPVLASLSDDQPQACSLRPSHTSEAVIVLASRSSFLLTTDTFGTSIVIRTLEA
jgi:hypothetical protein